MGKKSTKNSCRQEKRQQIPSLVKILRPKVYITDTTNFKKLVQELTGKSGNSSSPAYSPPPPYVVPSEPVPFDSLSFDSASFSAPLEMEGGSSPEFGSPDSLNVVEGSEKIDLSWQYRELESFLMEMDNSITSVSSSSSSAAAAAYNCDACYGYGMLNATNYEYSPLSTFII